DRTGTRPEQRDPAGPTPALVRARVLARPPAGQLPADALGHREGGEQPVVPPQPGMFLPVRADHPHLDAHARKAAGGQAVVHPLGERLGGEHHGLGQLGRRIEGNADRQVGRGRAAGGRGPRPRASRCAAPPGTPNLFTARLAGSRAKSPSVTMPSRGRSSVSSSLSSALTGYGARNSRACPGGTTVAEPGAAARAASRAADSPPATPARPATP